MVQSNSSDDLNKPENETEETEETEDEGLQEVTDSPSRPGAVRWIALISMVLMLAGLGFGWRWWAGRQANPAGGPMAGQPQAVPVKLETLEPETVEDYTEFIGSLESQQSVTVRPEVTGRVSQIFVASGDRVTAGTPLVQLQPDQQAANLASVIASVNSARAIRANARSQIDALEAERIAQQAEVQLQVENYNRTSFLVEQGALPQQQLDQAMRDRQAAQANLNAIEQRIQAAQASFQESEAGLQQAQANANRANAQLQETTIVAPFDGVVGDIPVRLGDVVTNSDTLTTLTQSDSLDLRVSIPLERAPDLQMGQPVLLIDGQGNVVSRGQVSFIAPGVDTSAQSILAKATFSNPSRQLRDGQFVRARVIWRSQPGLLIPTVAITRLAGEPFVFVAEAPQPEAGAEAPAGDDSSPSLIARQRPVTLGNLQGNSYQVLSGVEPGERLVVSGILNLADGVPIMPTTEVGQAAPSPAAMP